MAALMIFTIIVGLDHNHEVKGTMVMDDGIKTGRVEFGNYSFTFFKNNRLSVSVHTPLSRLMNANSCLMSRSMDFESNTMLSKGNIYDMNVAFDEINKVLTLTTSNKHPLYDVGNLFLE